MNKPSDAVKTLLAYGWTLQEIADDIGSSVSSVWRIKNEQVEPGHIYADKLRALAHKVSQE